MADEKYPLKTGQEVTLESKDDKGKVIDSVTLPEYANKHNFTYPEADKLRDEFKELAGTKKSVQFTFGRVPEKDDTLAAEVMRVKGWTIVQFVNDELESLARSSSYQKELNDVQPYQTTRKMEKVEADIIRDMVLTGLFTEEEAKATLASKKALANA